MSMAVLQDPDLSQFAKNKEMWTLDRKKSIPSTLVWTHKHITRRREHGKICVISTIETITWTRSNDTMLFSGRSAPRTPPVLISNMPHKKKYASNKSKRPCACGHPDCNDIAKSISQATGVENIQSNLIRRARRPKPRIFGAAHSPRSRPGLSTTQEHDAKMQAALNISRVQVVNRLRASNKVKALRGGRFFVLALMIVYIHQ